MIGIAKSSAKGMESNAKALGFIQMNAPMTLKNKALLRSKLFSRFPDMDYFVIVESEKELIIYKNKRKHEIQNS